LKFEVTDTGPGINLASQKTLFQKYQQFSELGNKKLGTGLGLWITKNLCDKMNGQISVKSELGKGTTFTISLRTKESIIQRLTTSFEEKEDEFNKLRIMIVEDDPFLSQIIARYIEDSGLPIDIINIASNGKEAFDYFEDALRNGHLIDAITMDLEMPVMGGKEASIKIRELETQESLDPVRIYIISANCLESEIRECLDSNGKIRADEFFRKPVKREELLLSLSKLAKSKLKKKLRINTVLVVDDDPFNLKLIEEMLKKQDVKCLLAQDGIEALEMYYKNSKNISLILMDCEMRIMNGWAATEKILDYCKSNGINPPIVYGLTGHTSKEVEERCHNSGMRKILRKPLSYYDLIENIRNFASQ
jgi:FOG: CheY-like receiver